MSDASTLLERMTARAPQMRLDLQALVESESPSNEPEIANRCADVVERLGTRLLGRGPTVHELGGRRHLHWRGDGPGRVLLLAHYDTVWPAGTLAERPFRIDGHEATGPGVFDMKAGIVQGLHALAEVGLDGVELLVNADEEIGSPTSADLIGERSRACGVVLVLEPSADGGAIKTERKGTIQVELMLGGRAAHAGLEPERGISTTVALGPVIQAAAALADPGLGTTVVPTTVRSGSVANAVPDRAVINVDVRAWSTDELDRVMAGLQRAGAGAALISFQVVECYRREPIGPAASGALFQRLGDVARRLGLPDPVGAAVGGCSDGNLAAAAGAAVLDGLGPVGGGAHAIDERVDLDHMPRRAALLAGLLTDLLATPGDGGR